MPRTKISHLEDILRRQKEKVDRGELAIDEDSEFHYAIAQAAKNSVVLKVLDVFMDLLRESREHSLQLEGRLQKFFAGHRRILAPSREQIRRPPRKPCGSTSTKSKASF